MYSTEREVRYRTLAFETIFEFFLVKKNAYIIEHIIIIFSTRYELARYQINLFISDEQGFDTSRTTYFFGLL